MNDVSQPSCKYFLTYSGIKLPLNLCQPLEESSVVNRNTYFRAWYDSEDRITVIHKVVYGEVEMEHHYQYQDNGLLAEAEIVDADGDVKVVSFDENGMPQR